MVAALEKTELIEIFSVYINAYCTFNNISLGFFCDSTAPLVPYECTDSDLKCCDFHKWLNNKFDF